MQCAVMEFARNVCGMADANSTEFDAKTANPVIDLMEHQRAITSKGGTMRLGSYRCLLGEGTWAREAYGVKEISERHRHRYELNNAFRDPMAQKGMLFSGLSPDGRLVEIVEVKDHPWFVGCQFHPEFQSTPLKAHPLFRSFVAAAVHQRSGGKG
jgi:CTP synthase